jgi:DinB family protein
MSRRAELLADRIEEGAAGLAAFAEKLSEEEWKVPMALGNDRRPVGTIVHHVASIYPIEIEVARAVAGGQAPDVTWDAVAELNAKHAREVAGVSKAATLELLRKNSREAAAAVRKLTDEELDRATPLPLYYGAPVTAQLVIEDHALRHSWHHLFRIRAALEHASQSVAESRAKAS